MSDNIHLLSGAYALDALPPHERAFFERHLAACDACRGEVAGYRETAAAMGMAAADVPPAALRARVLHEVASTRQTSPLPGPHPTLRERLAPHLAAVAVAVAAVVVSLAGASVYVSEVRRDAAPVALDEGFLAIAEVVALEGPEAAEARFLYSADADEGYLVVSGLDALGDDGDYQLWLFHDGTPVAAGVFDIDNGHATVRAEAPVRDAEVIAVTAEPAGGLPEPSGPVLLQAELADTA